MKRLIQIVIVSVAIIAAIPNYTKAQEININVFYNTLNSYGRWMNYGNYGQVWICNVRDFVPYQTAGHWEYTDYGWTWVSDYDWGWAPFHYGRWAYDNMYGWMWVPGYEWAPAWVSWRSSGQYYGWAPLAPGVNINVAINTIPANRWCFVPVSYINSPKIHNYYVNRTKNVTIINQTTIINNTNIYNNTRYIAGPRRDDVERVTGRTINQVRVNNASTPGNTRVVNNTVNMYRPVVKRENAGANNSVTVANRNGSADNRINNAGVNRNDYNNNYNRTNQGVVNNERNNTNNRAVINNNNGERGNSAPERVNGNNSQQRSNANFNNNNALRNSRPEVRTQQSRIEQAPQPQMQRREVQHARVQNTQREQPQGRSTAAGGTQQRQRPQRF